MRKIMRLAAALLLLQLRLATAAVTFHQVASSQISTLTTPFVIGINVTSSTNSVMFVGFCAANGVSNEVSAITFQSLPLTLVEDISNASNNTHAYLYRLINPPVANGTVSITIASGRRAAGGAIVLHTVDQTTPNEGDQSHANDATTNNTTVNVTTEVNDMLIDVGCKRSTSNPLNMTAVTNRIQRYNIATAHATPSNNVIAGGSTLTGAGALTMSWTGAVNNSYSMAATNVNDAVVTPATKMSLGFRLLR